MNFVLQPSSLQHLAAVKTVAALWNHPDIVRQLAEQTRGDLEEVGKKWTVIQIKVLTNAFSLELTQVCRQQLINFFYPLVMEMVRWCGYHYITVNSNNEYVFLNCSLPKQFCWTMRGTVDYAKTAQLMLKDERLGVEERYEIACVNCLEDEARELMKLIPEDRLQNYTRSDRVKDVSRLTHFDLIFFFTCTLRGQDVPFRTRGVSINQHIMFLRTAHSGNPSAFEYFFKKLTQPEKEWVLGRNSILDNNFGRKIHYCNLLYYLSRMNKEQQERVFGERCADVLVLLLHWPMQSLFKEAAEGGRRFMVEERDYEKVLGAIADKVGPGKHRDGTNYLQLFWQFWRLTPADVQRGLLDNVEFLERLCETAQEEVIRLIYSEAPAHQASSLEDRVDTIRQAENLRKQEIFSRIKDNLEELRRMKRRRL